MTWTTFTTELDPDKPGRSVDIKAINANITAQANGDSGAPKQKTAGIADGALSADAAGRAKMANNYLSADATGRGKMQDGFVSAAKIDSVTTSSASSVEVLDNGIDTITVPFPAGNLLLQVYITIFEDSGLTIEAGETAYGNCNVIQSGDNTFKIRNDSGGTLYFKAFARSID